MTLLFLDIRCSLWHRNILKGDHNEDWCRVMAYGDLFDFIFCGQTGYGTKRYKVITLNEE